MSGRASAALDAAGRGAELVRSLVPWVGVLVLSALPARLLLAYFVWQGWRLAQSAAHHSDALHVLAVLYLAAWIVAQIGRQFFVRACRITLDGGQPQRAAVLRVPWITVLMSVWLALLLELFFWLTLPMVVLGLPLMLFAAIGTASVAEAKPGWWAPVQRLLQVSRPVPLLILGLGFILALPLAVANVHLFIVFTLWLIQGVAGCDIAFWQALLSPGQTLYWIQVTAGATLLLEPFWLAAAVVEVRQARAQRSGEDLSQWFGELIKRPQV